MKKRIALFIHATVGTDQRHWKMGSEWRHLRAKTFTRAILRKTKRPQVPTTNASRPMATASSWYPKPSRGGNVKDMHSLFRQRLVRPVLCSLLFLSAGAHAQDGRQNPTDDEIRQRLVQASIAAYPGACPCPENLTRSGARCGKNSAYSKPGGAQPLCYPIDVSDAMVTRYREQLPKR